MHRLVRQTLPSNTTDRGSCAFSTSTTLWRSAFEFSYDRDGQSSSHRLQDRSEAESLAYTYAMRIVSLLNIDPATKVATTNIRPSKRAQRSIAFVVRVHVAFCRLLGERRTARSAEMPNRQISSMTSTRPSSRRKRTSPRSRFPRHESSCATTDSLVDGHQTTRKNDVPIERTTKERKPRLPVPSYSLVKPGKIS